MKVVRRDSPAAERNRGPILEVLRQVLPAQGRVLEIAAGSGQHAAFFAAALPGLRWQPSEAEPAALAAIRARLAGAPVDNVLPPLQLDVERQPWPIRAADAVFCCNMLHIAPWRVSRALFRGAANVLTAGAPLLIYGPFFTAAAPAAASNLAFDAQLRSRNPAWGIRALDDLRREAAANAFILESRRAMPANNWTLIFRRQPPTEGED